MKKIIYLVAICFVQGAFAQVGINTENPQGIFNVDGARDNATTGTPTAAQQANDFLVMPDGEVGIGTAPGTSLDVNGAITVTAAAAPNAGQRMIVYNTTSGGFTAALNSFPIANGQALEFIYSNGGWRSTDNGAGTVGGLNDWHLTGNAGTNATTNFIGTTNAIDFVIRSNNTEQMRVSSAGNVGIGTTIPANKLHVKATTDPLRLEGLQNSTATTDHPLVVDNNGVVKSAPAVKGLLSQVYNLVGTTALNVAVGTESDVPGVSQNFTTTTNTMVQISVIGYAALLSTGTGQGVFSIYINGTRVTSVYVSSYTGSLTRMPIPATQNWNAILAAGAHTIKVTFKNWAVAGAGAGSTDLRINQDPVADGYSGATGVDANAMKTRMSISIYNN